MHLKIVPQIRKNIATKKESLTDSSMDILYLSLLDF